MSDILKVPNSDTYCDLYRLEDILDLMKEGYDKDLIRMIMTHCEKQIALDLQKGLWVGIPFIGNVRINKIRQALNSKENKEIIDGARSELNPSDFRKFRIQFSQDVARNINIERFNNYILSKTKTNFKKVYSKFFKKYGEDVAKVVLKSFMNLECVSSNDELEYEERVND